MEVSSNHSRSVWGSAAAVLGVAALVALASAAQAGPGLVDTSASPNDMAGAMGAATVNVAGGSLVTSSDPAATGRGFSPNAGFAVDGADFAVLSTGDAQDAQGVTEASASTNHTVPVPMPPGAPPPAIYDVTTFRVDFDVSPLHDCVAFSYKVFTEEPAEADANRTPDGFIAELDASTWTMTPGGMNAPDDITGNDDGVQSSESFFSAAEAANTPYDRATPVLHAFAEVTTWPSHSLYFTVYDGTDGLNDTAVFLDDLRAFQSDGRCGPSVHFTDALPQAGPESTANPDINVTVDQPVAYEIEIQGSHAGGTATPGSDYTIGPTLVPAATAAYPMNFEVHEIGGCEEGLENVILWLVSAQGASNGASVRVVNPDEKNYTIIDNDACTLSVQDDMVTEGMPTAPLNPDLEFVIEMNTYSSKPVTVDYYTEQDSATSTADYLPRSGNVTFQPGQTQKTVRVPVVSEDICESNERMYLRIANASVPTVILDDRGEGWILDDDTCVLEVQGGATVEQDTTNPVVTFNVTLDPESEKTVRVDYETNTGTALSPDDYVYTAGTLTFQAGETYKLVDVEVEAEEICESNEFFFLELSNPENATLHSSRWRDAGVILNDDLCDVWIEDASEWEDDPGVTPLPQLDFKIHRSGQSEVPISFQFETLDGTARAAQPDYDAKQGTQTIAPGQSNVSNRVDIRPDDLCEGDENMTLRLLAITSGPGRINRSDGIGTILDNEYCGLSVDDTATLELDPPSRPVMVFSVTLNDTRKYPVTVDYRTLDLTAFAADPDYQATSGTLTFQANETQKSVQVPVEADKICEGDHIFQLELDNAWAGNATNRTQVAILDPLGNGTIVDDDDCELSVGDETTVEFDPGSSSADPVLTFNVTLTHVSEDPVEVNYTTQDATAVAPGDYQATSGNLTFQPGETYKHVDVQVWSDEVCENDEWFEFHLEDPKNATLAANGTGAPDFAIGNITNDDFCDVWVEDDSEVEQDPGFTPLPQLRFQIRHNGTTEANITVDYQVNDVTAAAAQPDFYPPNPNPGTVTLNDTEPDATIVVEVEPDALCEYNETLELILSNIQGPGTINRSRGEGLIIDDEVCGMWIDDASAPESAATLDFVVHLNDTRQYPVEVEYRTLDGTADSTGANPDYTATTGTLTFNQGETSKVVEVPLIQDSVCEDDETLQVELSNARSGGAGGTTPDPVLLFDDIGNGTILDDDDCEISIFDATPVVEGHTNHPMMNFTVQLNASSQNPVEVNWTTQDATAVAPDDYWADSGTVTFPPFNTTQELQVQVRSERLCEFAEHFLVLLSDPVNATMGDDEAEGNITDDDLCGFEVTDESEIEGDAGTTAMTFTITKDGEADHPVSVDYATSDVTAVAPDDYIARSGTVLFATDEYAKTVVIDLVGEKLCELDEEFEMQLSNPTGSTQINRSTGSGTIRNDDTCRLKVKDTTATENQPNLLFEVTMDKASSQTVTVDYSSADITATAGADYTAVSGTLSFAPGEQTKTVAVPILDDKVCEQDELMELQLSNPTNAVIDDGRAEGEIVDDDACTVSVSDARVQEGDTVNPWLNFTVRLDASVQEDVEVDWETAPVTAASDVDYYRDEGTVVFPAGNRTQWVEVEVIAEQLCERDEFVHVLLTDARGPGVSIADGVGNGTIVNDDWCEVRIGNATVVEGDPGMAGADPVLRFDVRRDGDIDHNVSVQYQTSDITARAVSDYEPDAGTLWIPKDVENVTLEVQVWSDLRDEPDESLRVNLSAPNGSVDLVQPNGTGWIIDDDDPYISVVTTDEVADEEDPADTAHFEMGRTQGNLSFPLDVEYEMWGVAVNGGDYDRFPGTATFPRNVSLINLTVTAIADGQPEGVEPLTIRLVDGSGYNLGAPDNATAYITDDEDGDGTTSYYDNCPLVRNPDQADMDGDGEGDACDDDADNDGLPDGEDNCPTTFNPGQGDRDGDGIGDKCDPNSDDSTDSDRDGVVDHADNCPSQINRDQNDSGGRGVGDACDRNATSGGGSSDGSSGDDGGPAELVENRTRPPADPVKPPLDLAAVCSAHPMYFYDLFDSDPRLSADWRIHQDAGDRSGLAAWTGSAVQLTRAVPERAVAMVAREPMPAGAWTASFDYRLTGEAQDGEGFSFFFYKDGAGFASAELGDGGQLGLADAEAMLGGHAVEFDAVAQSWDPSGPHVALVGADAAAAPVASAPMPDLVDGEWHRVRILHDPANRTLSVEVDEARVLHVTDFTAATNLRGFGFSAATGDPGLEHRVDDLVVCADPSGGSVAGGAGGADGTRGGAEPGGGAFGNALYDRDGDAGGGSTTFAGKWLEAGLGMQILSILVLLLILGAIVVNVLLVRRVVRRRDKEY